MVYRCPKCRFTANLADPSRLTPHDALLCPRCQTIMSPPHSHDHAPPFLVEDASRPQQPPPLPWESRSSWLDLTAFWRTSMTILFRPRDAFTALHYNAGIRSSLVYVLVYGALGHIIGRYWFTIAGIHLGVLEADALGNAMRFAGTALFTPLLLAVYLFFVAALVHLVLKLLSAARRSYGTTLQVLAYVAGATSLLNLIPILGNLLIPIWALVLDCIGLATAHQTSKTRVLFALLLPFILTGLLILGVMLLAAALGVLKFLATIPWSL